MNNRKGFTLIEALLVAAVVGLLMTVSIYGVGQAQRQGRDARRKSDLTTLSLAFQARYNDKVCNSDLEVYPGQSLGANLDWVAVSTLTNYSDGCGPFTDYLTRLPQDPKHDATEPYRFNLSTNQLAKHYRLSARLEKTLSLQESQELGRMVTTWEQTFAGRPLRANYNFLVGN